MNSVASWLWKRLLGVLIHLLGTLWEPTGKAWPWNSRPPVIILSAGRISNVVFTSNPSLMHGNGRSRLTNLHPLQTTIWLQVALLIFLLSIRPIFEQQGKIYREHYPQLTRPSRFTKERGGFRSAKGLGRMNLAKGINYSGSNLVSTPWDFHNMNDRPSFPATLSASTTDRTIPGR